MDKPAEGEAPFDERAALDELERLRGQIDRYKSERKAAEERFEHFVRSFKTAHNVQDAPSKGATPTVLPRVTAPPETPPVKPVPQPPRVVPPPRVEVPPPPREVPRVVTAPQARVTPLPPEVPGVGTRPQEVPRTATSPVPGATVPRQRPPERPAAAMVSPAPVPASDFPSELSAPHPTPRTRPLVLAAALLLLVAGALAIWTMRDRGTEPAAATAAAPAVASPSPAAQAPPPPQPEPVPAPPAAELTTIRTVWMRVIVDGERILEKEVAAGTRIPLTPANTIVIRTGDAGAVRLSIAGKDQGLLGREGQVVTRTFDVTATR